MSAEFSSSDCRRQVVSGMALRMIRQISASVLFMNLDGETLDLVGRKR